nr:MAG TPA: hypothetical protein [Caudoviricetes sp.]
MPRTMYIRPKHMPRQQSTLQLQPANRQELLLTVKRQPRTRHLQRQPARPRPKHLRRQPRTRHLQRRPARPRQKPVRPTRPAVLARPAPAKTPRLHQPAMLHPALSVQPAGQRLQKTARPLLKPARPRRPIAPARHPDRRLKLRPAKLQQRPARMYQLPGPRKLKRQPKAPAHIWKKSTALSTISIATETFVKESMWRWKNKWQQRH